MSPTADDGYSILLTAMRQDWQNFRTELRRDMEDFVTKQVFQSEMRLRDQKIEALERAQTSAANAVKDERAERKTNVRWLVGLIGGPTAALVVNQLWQAVQH